ncbi:Zinc/iron permease [Trypanosoma melophagium]|uniref:Zinc/iron permease n=1 Tax=Trypanosoma melophagium TaxID=715481 RepID=UPI00351A852D|nr:Zinc/iron permease [Trypanosoma melophagium]
MNNTEDCSALLSQHASLESKLTAQQCDVPDSHDHGHEHGHEHGHSHGGCGGADGPYSVGLHVAAIFIVLVVSFLGTFIPLAGKYVPVLKIHPFVFVLGKCAATGVVLAVAMIHMINHAAHAFQEACVPVSFQESYDAYAFLFAMIAAVLMHALEMQLDLMFAGGSARPHQWSLLKSRTSLEVRNVCLFVLTKGLRRAPQSWCSPRCGGWSAAYRLSPVHGVRCDAAQRVHWADSGHHEQRGHQGAACGALVPPAVRGTCTGLTTGGCAAAHLAGAVAGANLLRVCALGHRDWRGRGRWVEGLGNGDDVCVAPGDIRCSMRWYSSVPGHAGADSAYRGLKRFVMFLALWAGAGVMAGIGKWL